MSADTRFASALLSDCAICYSPLEYPVLVPCCQNLFCTACMLAWLRERPGAACPACRAPNVRLTRIATPAPEAGEPGEAPEGQAREAAAPRPELRSKAATVLEIVTAARAGVLIYSTHKLDEAGVSHSELQGRSTTRDKALRCFRAGSVKTCHYKTPSRSSVGSFRSG